MKIKLHALFVCPYNTVWCTSPTSMDSQSQGKVQEEPVDTNEW